MSNVTTFRRTSDFGAFADAALDFPRIIERSTVYPWIVTIHAQKQVEYGSGVDHVSFPRFELIREIVQAPMSKPPVAEDFVPEGHILGRADIFPATRFDDMPVAVRANYKAEYRAYLTWRKAHALGKKVADLIPWEELDPILRDEQVDRWARGVAP